MERFIQAQTQVWPGVLAELKSGRKQSHWMWFVFPQIAGLGHSAMAQTYAIRSMGEARAYLEHPVLGTRLREALQLVLDVQNKSAHAIFGSPDDLKFRSSMTLFDAAELNSIFAAALRKYFNGIGDPVTMSKIAMPPP